MRRPSDYNIPWKQILAEGAAIVFSILLAFAIDAWWDGRRTQAREVQIRADLLAEFETNVEPLNQFIQLYEYELNLGQALLNTPDSIRSLSGQEQSRVLSALVYKPTFDPHDAMLSSLIRSGDLDRMEDVQLKALISRWIDQNEDLHENWPTITEISKFFELLTEKDLVVEFHSIFNPMISKQAGQESYFSVLVKSEFEEIPPRLQQLLFEPAFHSMLALRLISIQSVIVELRMLRSNLQAVVDYLRASQK